MIRSEMSYDLYTDLRVTRQPLTHKLVTNIIGSLADVRVLKCQALMLIAFLVILFFSFSALPHDILTVEQNNLAQPIAYMEPLEKFSPLQQRQLVYEGNPLPAERALRLSVVQDVAQYADYKAVNWLPMSATCTAISPSERVFPLTVILKGKRQYVISDIARLYYGTDNATRFIREANPNIDLRALKTGDKLTFPKVLPDDLGKTSHMDFTAVSVSSSNVPINPVASPPTAALSLDKGGQSNQHLSASASDVTKTAPESSKSDTLPADSAAHLSHTGIGSSNDTATAKPTAASTQAAGSAEAPSYVIAASNADIDLLTRVVAAESGATWDVHAVEMVAQTIVNRVRNGWGSLHYVLTAPEQYTVYENGSYLTINPTATHKAAVAAVLKGAEVLPRSTVYFCNDWVYQRDSWWQSLQVDATFDGMMFFSP